MTTGTSIEGTLQFIKAEPVLNGDVLTIYIPKNFKMFQNRIKEHKKELLEKYGARKLRFDTKKKDEVILDLKTIDVTILDEINDRLINAVHANEYMAIDFETDSENAMTAKIISVGLSFCKGKETYYLPIEHTNAKNIPIEVVMEFLRLAVQLGVKFVVHNLSFEKKLLDRYKVYPEYIDTMILTYLKGGLRRHGLKAVAKERLGVRMTTFDEVVGKGKDKKRFQDVDLETAAQYCGSDALYTAELLDLLLEELDNDLINLDHKAALVCSNMEARGVLIDTDQLSRLKTFCERRKNRLEKLIFATAQEEFNINSPKQLGMILYGKLGMTPDSRHGYTDTGNLATGAEAIDALIRNGEDNRILKHLKEYRNMVKIIGTYIERLTDGISSVTNRYHPYFNFVGAETGRLSSDFQQLPASGVGARVREAVIAPEGYTVVAADYSQIELRILAHLMQDEKVNQMIRDGVDMHTATASIVFGIPVDQIEKDGMERRVGKTMNFAIVYGRGDHNVAEDLGVSLAKAKKFKEKYFEGFPKLKSFIESRIQSAREKGYSETMAGRRRYLPDINSKNKARRARAERQAFNAEIQGSAADLARQAMYVVEQVANRFEAEFILQVHDEFCFYVPNDRVDSFSSELKLAMEMHNICGTKINVPIKVDIGIGKNYFEAK